jgi:hypothetical protein
MSLVGKPPKTTTVKIKVDMSGLVKAFEGMARSVRRMGAVRRQRAAEWRNTADQINVWESEGGAL